MRIAIEEGAVPPAAIAGFEQLGYSLWYLPRSEGREIARLVSEFPPDLVVLPLEPRTAEASQIIKASNPDTRIMVASEAQPDLKIQPDWADLVVPSSSDPVLWMLSVLSLQRTEEGPEGAENWKQTLVKVIENTHKAFRSMAGRNSTDRMVSELRERLETSFQLLLRVLLDRLEREIPGYAGHSSRVSLLGRRLGEELGLPSERSEIVAVGGLLHDLGMHLVLPSAALQRPGPLHSGEWDVVRSHPIASAAVSSPLLGGAAEVAIREHHERLDGSGYPLAKKGDEISLEARIVTVADAFQAMTHPRPHRQALPVDQALESLRQEARSGRLDREVCAALPGAIGHLPQER